MELLYIVNARMPTEKAHGLHVAKMCEALAAAGAAVTLVLPQRENAVAGDLFAYYGIKKIFKVRYVPVIDLIGKGFWGYWITQILFSLGLLKLGFNKSKHVVITRDELTGWLMSTKGFRVFYDMHGFPETWVGLWRVAMRKMTGIICTNEWKMRQMQNFFKITHNRMILARNGFDPREFNITISKDEARRQLGLPLGGRLAVYTGHLYDWKGADVLAEATAHLPQVTAVFAGGVAQDVAGFTARHSASRNILVLGHQPHAIIPLYLQAADVLVLPNSRHSKNPRAIPYSIYDTSPIKLFEYMASRRPIVASDLPSIREVLNEDMAVFFTPDNPLELARSIESVLRDPDGAEKRVSRAALVVQEYAWEKRAARILGFIKSLAAPLS